jgi:hypothetical protein
MALMSIKWLESGRSINIDRLRSLLLALPVKRLHYKILKIGKLLIELLSLLSIIIDCSINV